MPCWTGGGKKKKEEEEMHRRRKAYMAIDSKSAKPWDNLQQIKELHKRHLEKKKGIKERSPTDIVIKV